MNAVHEELARLGSATVYEASGRRGLVDLDLQQVIPGSRACGPARTVLCGQGDNLMVHAAMDRAQPGDVLVLTMPEPEPVALIGDLLVTQAKARGVAALLVDAAVRDVEELRALGVPVWTRWVRVRGAVKSTVGQARRDGGGRRHGDQPRRRGGARHRRRGGGGAPSACGRCSRPRTGARTRSARSA